MELLTSKQVGTDPHYEPPPIPITTPATVHCDITMPIRNKENPISPINRTLFLFIFHP